MPETYVSTECPNFTVPISRSQTEKESSFLVIPLMLALFMGSKGGLQKMP